MHWGSGSAKRRAMWAHAEDRRSRRCRFIAWSVAAMTIGASAVVAQQPVAAIGTADFSIALSAGPTFNPGTTGTFTATVTPINGESSPITLVALPTLVGGGVVTATLPAQVVSAPYSSPVTFTLSVNAHEAATPTTYSVTVEGMDDNGNVHPASTQFTISSPAASYVQSSNGITSITVQQGANGTVPVTITPQNGFNAEVDLIAYPWPAAAGGVLPVATWGNGAPATSVSSPYPTQVLTVTVPPRTPLGTYHFTIGSESSNGNGNPAWDLAVDVVASATATFSLSVSSCPTFNPGASSSFSVTVTPLNGETSPVTLVPTQGLMQVTLPAAVVQAPYQQPAQFTVSENAKVGAQSQTITVIGVDDLGNTFEASTSCATTANAADFTFSAPSSVTLPQGTSANAVISFSPANGMNAHIELVAAPVSAATNQQPIALFNALTPADDVSAPYLSQNLNINASPRVAVGTYQVEVIATSANAASTYRSAVISVTVTPGSTGDYQLAVSGSPTINPGGTGSFSITVTPLGAENLPITLIPEQSVGQITPAAQPLLAPYGKADFTISVNVRTPPNAYKTQVVGVDGNGFVHFSADVNYTVSGAQADFRLWASNTAPAVAQGTPVSIGVGVTPANGLSSDVQLIVASTTGNPVSPEPVATWNGLEPAANVASPYPGQTLTFTVLPQTLPGTYHYIVRGTCANSASGVQTLAIDVTVGDTAPRFTLSLSAGPTFNPGTTATVTATITAYNDERAPIILVAEPSLAVPSQQVVVQPPYPPVTITLTSHAYDPPITLPLGVTATDGTNGTVQRQTTQYTLTNTPANFTLGTNPTNPSMQRGGTLPISVSVTPQNGLSSDVQLAVVPEPTGAAGAMPLATFENGTPAVKVSPPYAAPTLTFTDTSSESGGVYHYLVSAVSDNANPAQRTFEMTLTVVAPLLSVGVPNTTVNPGATGTMQVTVTPGGCTCGDMSPITLVPSQGPFTVSPATITVPRPSNGSAIATFQVTADANVPAQGYPIVVAAYDQTGVVGRGQATVTVTNVPASFGIAPASTDVDVAQGGQGSAALTISAFSGFSSTVELVAAPEPSVSGAVGPVATWSTGTPAASASPPYPQGRTLAIQVPPGTPLGTYHIVVTGTSEGAMPPYATADVFVHVTAPDTGFTLTEPSGPTIDPGSSGTVSVTVNPGAHETTPVTVYASGLPGTTSPTSVVVQPPYTTPATFTITLATTTPAGPYKATFVAVDGNHNVATTMTDYSASGTPASFGVQISSSPVTALAGEGSPATTKAVVAPSHGFTAPVSWTVVPAPDTQPGVQPSVTWAAGGEMVIVNAPQTEQVLDVVASQNVTAGTYHFVVTGASGNALPPVASADLYVTVPAPAGSPGAPVVSGVSPPNGPLTGGTAVTVTGSGFVPGETEVLFGNAPGTNVVVDTSTQSVPGTSLTVTSPPSCAGTVDVRVVTPAGSSPPVPEDEFTFDGQPRIDSISPASGTASASQTVIVTGANLGCPETTKVTGINLTAPVLTAAILNDPVHPNTTSQIELSVPPQPSGSLGHVVVTTGGGDSTDVPADLFSWSAPPPALSTASLSGPTQGGNQVSLTGQNLSFPTAVSFGGKPALGITANSDSQVTAVAPPGCGTVPVAVSTAAGTASSATYIYVPGIPSVTSLSQAAGPPAGGSAVVIHGTNLLCSTAVAFGTTPATAYHVDSDTQITATAPAGTAGQAVDVLVTNAVGQSATRAGDRFSFINAPTVTSVSPDAGPVAGGTQVTITGTNFAPAAMVTFGGRLASSTVVSPTTIQATAPAASTAGRVDVVVVTAGGSSSPSANGSYTYGTPVLSALTPSVGVAAGGNDVRISGSNFAPDTVVLFGGQQVAATVLSATSIDLPAAPAGPGGTSVSVTVRDPAGTSSSLSYTYAFRPRVDSISPQTGAAAGGISLTITGADLTASPVVVFGGVSAGAVTVNANGTLSVTVPPGTAGSQVDVTVRTVGGTSATTLNDAFSYLPPPQGSPPDPPWGPLHGTTPVTVLGSNFGASPTVTFGGVASSNVQVSRDGTQIVANSPAHATPATVNVVVTTGSGSTTVGTFTYDPVPTLTGITPNASTMDGGNTVTLTGTGFLHGILVYFGSAPGVVPTTVDPTGTWLTAVVPSSLLTAPVNGVINVSVHTAGLDAGVTTSSVPYAYGTPEVDAISIHGAALSTARAVTITGANFVSAGTTVSFGASTQSAVQATNVTVVNATTITATAPASTTSGWVYVFVQDTAGWSQANTAAEYVYGPPTLSSISPSAGPTTGGTLVTLAVSNFDNEQVSVSVGSTTVSSSSFTQMPGTPTQGTLTFTTPPFSATGSQNVSITVSTAGGTSGGQQYTYWAAPVVSAVTQSAGPTSGYRSVTITGANFASSVNLAVSFGSVSLPVQNVTLNSTTSITATTPAEVAGTVDVTVSSIGGTSATSSADHYQFMGQGLWEVERNGTMHTAGAAVNDGGPTWSQAAVVGMAETPDGRGYWVTAQDGGVFTFGDAGFYGSAANTRLTKPVSGIAATPDGRGYWLVAQDGGVFTYGDAGFFGSMGGHALNAPVVGITAAPSGQGYWLVGADGAVFAFGPDAHFLGAGTATCGGTCPNAFANIVATLDGAGYWMGQVNAGVFNYGNALFFGSYANQSGTTGWLGVYPTPSGQGYWFVSSWGSAYSSPQGDAGQMQINGVVGTGAGAASLFGA